MLWDHNGVLQRELERLRLQLRESRAERGLPAGGKIQEGLVSLPSSQQEQGSLWIGVSMGAWHGLLCLSCCCQFWYWAAMGGKKGVMGGEEEGDGGNKAIPAQKLVMVTCGLGKWE